MKVFHLQNQRSQMLDPKNFTGEGTLIRMDDVCDDPRTNIYRVAFSAGTRTAWHSHSGPQLLLIIDGQCRLQTEGKPIQEVTNGDMVCIAAREKHWHGATPGASMTHVAININATTEWLEKVTDAQYEGHHP